ncbi:MAG TPA: head GIN domain-containing protein [Draconibacterium sp.]|nr:head GIN domain-containing protein [Draconibacterium sp.]
MRKTVMLVTFIFISAILGSCIFMGSVEGNGKVTEQTRDLGEFNKISVTRGMNVYISQGDLTKVVIKADENLLDIIETTVTDGTLKVSCNRGIRKAESNKVFVTVTDLDLLKTTAGSNVFSEDTLHFQTLDVKSTAGSNVKLEVEAGEINLSAAAGSNIFLNGIVKSLNVKANSGSNIKAGDLQAENCDIKVSSGANIWIKVQNGLTAKASSGGNLFYSGEPNPLRITKSSGGNVIKN